jgi:DNA-binding beta-propeller fold protein YncE
MESMVRFAAMMAALAMSSACHASPRIVSANDPSSPLRLERTINLPGVAGRIDHLAIDLPHRQVFVAEYANGTVDAVDLESGKVVGRITGLHEPQGIAVLGDGQLVVACGDGSVHFYSAADRREMAVLNLGDDADNVRADARNGHVIVGYGGGALAVIDPAMHRLLSTLKLAGHPEGFRLAGAKVLINIPDRGSIVAADIDAGTVTATWSTGMRNLNFPLAIAPGGGWFALAYRLPAALQVRSMDGSVVSTRSGCGDADDLFVDGDRFLLVCGAGHVDLSSTTNTDGQIVRVTTAPGARTGLFVPELRSLIVAIPARGGAAAALWVLRTR